ncbi:MAG: Xaa-Pro peptidase family protein [Candidatus Eisenbacteria bacterium]|nr:Xaa-Pro peptidase family protein [Candidatus Eisenbacteria bacterium]
MRSDIPKLMKERGIGAIVILGGGTNNPVMTYMTGPTKLMRSVYVMKNDGSALLVHNPMERDEARETGIPCMSWPEIGLKRFVEEEKSELKGEARMIGSALEKLGVRGKVCFYGKFEASRLLAIVDFLKQRMSGLEIGLDEDKSVFDVARTTKDEHEVKRMRDVARRTCESIALVRDLLFSCPIKDDRLIKADGGRLKIGDLRSLLRTELIKRGLVEEGGTIISMGRDSAVPHNHGNDDDEVRPGRTIVMDVFPGEIGAGYAFDITRTYCVGEVPNEVQKIYQDVREAQRMSIESLRIDSPARLYQERVCDFFESRGYRTIRQDDGIEEGYVHGLGHGIGLEVQEKMRLAGPETNVDLIQRGSVFTVEPGLYYPSKGIGVRIEDVVYARPDGKFEVLMDFPRELSPTRIA